MLRAIMIRPIGLEAICSQVRLFESYSPLYILITPQQLLVRGNPSVWFVW